jgi:hypothetical protein
MENNETLFWLLLMIFILTFAIVYYAFAIVQYEIEGMSKQITDYHSETKAFDISQHLRCDFYLEYRGDTLTNITRTDCIVIP